MENFKKAQIRSHYAAGADGEQDVNAGPAEMKPQKEQEIANDDHSEAEWGGDQDIDTAGLVPGNKATDEDEPTGL
jgi:hypothetical protein